MSAITDLRSALRANLLTVSGLPPVAWQNRAFEPTPGSPWLRETLLPAGANLASIAGVITEALLREDGIYQITVFYPAGGDLKAAESLVDSIRSAFRPGIVVTHGGIAAVCTRAEVARAVQEPDWYGIPISIRYYLHRLNT